MRLYYINSITTHGRRVWSLALKGREDIERFKGLGWGLRTWDQWEWNDTWCDKQVCDNSETVVSHEWHEWGTNET